MVECYWPEMTEDGVREVLERVAWIKSPSGQEGVRPLGSFLVPSDGMVIFLFEGSSAAIRDAAEVAEVPFDRIVEFHHITVGSQRA